nr:NUDIX domain protein [uncultured bacterium]
MTSKNQPAFKPKSGQIDFTNVRWTPVLNCVVRYKNKILVVQRSENLNFYPSYWNGVAGFLDDKKSLKEKVEEELRDELQISKNKIKKIQLGEIFDQEEPKYKKTWIVHPVLVTVTTDTVKLDWEAQKYRWTSFSEAKKLKLLPGFDEVLKRVSKL